MLAPVLVDISRQISTEDAHFSDRILKSSIHLLQKERQEFKAREENLSHYVILLHSKLHKEQIAKAILEERIKTVIKNIIDLIDNLRICASCLKTKTVVNVVCSKQVSHET